MSNRLGVPVKVRWPDRHVMKEVSGLLTTDHATSSYGIPVLVLVRQRQKEGSPDVYEGLPHGIGDLPEGTTIMVRWNKARTGPVWQVIEAGVKAGFPIEIEL